MKELKADFGYDAPRQTKRPCTNPEFIDTHLHRIAIMKREFLYDGLQGWTVKGICTGCLREFRVRGFYPMIAEKKNGRIK